MPKSKVRKKKTTNRDTPAPRTSVKDIIGKGNGVTTEIVEMPDGQYKLRIRFYLKTSDRMGNTNPNTLNARTDLPALNEMKLECGAPMENGPSNLVDEFPEQISSTYLLPELLLTPEFDGREYHQLIPSIWEVIGYPLLEGASYASMNPRNYMGFIPAGTVEDNNEVLWEHLTQVTREAEDVVSTDPDKFFRTLPAFHGAMTKMFEAYTIAVTGEPSVPNTKAADIFTEGIIEMLFGNPYLKHGFDFFTRWVMSVSDSSIIDFSILTKESVGRL